MKKTKGWEKKICNESNCRFSKTSSELWTRSVGKNLLGWWTFSSQQFSQWLCEWFKETWSHRVSSIGTNGFAWVLYHGLIKATGWLNVGASQKIKKPNICKIKTCFGHYDLIPLWHNHNINVPSVDLCIRELKTVQALLNGATVQHQQHR